MNRLTPQIGLLLLLAFCALTTGNATDDPGAEGVVVRQVVRDWASAWRAGKFNEYAAYYVAGFKGSYTSNKRWREERSKRINGRNDIRVDLGPLLVQFSLDDPAVARVVFLQSYRSNSWCDVVEKTLGLRKTELGWRIDSEDSQTRNRC
ncbi:MAG: hypothetical protein HKO07_04735 [Pseudomonadales bacterium]|nr:hypothetical protein [Pseudomonadales bacterium]